MLQLNTLLTDQAKRYLTTDGLREYVDTYNHARQAASDVRVAHAIKSIQAIPDEPPPPIGVPIVEEVRDLRRAQEVAAWLIVIGTAAVAGFTAYEAQYLGNATFGARLLDYIKLLGWGVTFTAAGGVLAQLLPLLRSPVLR